MWPRVSSVTPMVFVFAAWSFFVHAGRTSMMERRQQAKNRIDLIGAPVGQMKNISR
jgi:hypothetical protein